MQSLSILGHVHEQCVGGDDIRWPTHAATAIGRTLSLHRKSIQNQEDVTKSDATRLLLFVAHSSSFHFQTTLLRSMYSAEKAIKCLRPPVQQAYAASHESTRRNLRWDSSEYKVEVRSYARADATGLQAWLDVKTPVRAPTVDRIEFDPLPYDKPIVSAVFLFLTT